MPNYLGPYSESIHARPQFTGRMDHFGRRKRQPKLRREDNSEHDTIQLELGSRYVGQPGTVFLIGQLLIEITEYNRDSSTPSGTLCWTRIVGDAGGCFAGREPYIEGSCDTWWLEDFIQEPRCNQDIRSFFQTVYNIKYGD